MLAVAERDLQVLGNRRHSADQRGAAISCAEQDRRSAATFAEQAIAPVGAFAERCISIQIGASIGCAPGSVKRLVAGSWLGRGAARAATAAQRDAQGRHIRLRAPPSPSATKLSAPAPRSHSTWRT